MSLVQLERVKWRRIWPGQTLSRSAPAPRPLSAAPNSWIWVDPPADLAGGDSYQVSITVQGTGDVYLDFWNGQQDVTTDPVQLTSTPQTFTLQAQVPATADTHLQVRTASTGPLDLYASAASVQLLTPETSG